MASNSVEERIHRIFCLYWKPLQHDKTARVRNTLIHVIGQIAYKKGCLETVVAELKRWENRTLVNDALEEIIDVHERYKNFAVKTQEEIRKYIEEFLKSVFFPEKTK